MRKVKLLLLACLVAIGLGALPAHADTFIQLCSAYGTGLGNASVQPSASPTLYANSAGCIQFDVTTDPQQVALGQLLHNGWLPAATATGYGTSQSCALLLNGTTKFVPNPSYSFYSIQMWGGGGGGGGGYTATYGGGGGGGSTGCLGMGKFTNPTGETVAIGAAGAAGVGGATPTAGGAGGNTTITAATGDFAGCTAANGGTSGGAATSSAQGAAGGAGTAATLASYGWLGVTGAVGTIGSAPGGAGGATFSPGGAGGADTGANGAVGAAGGMLICPLR